jgi:hypothetical protein
MIADKTETTKTVIYVPFCTIIFHLSQSPPLYSLHDAVLLLSVACGLREMAENPTVVEDRKSVSLDISTAALEGKIVIVYLQI